MTPSPVSIRRPQCKRCKFMELRCDPRRPCKWCREAGIGAEGCLPGDALVGFKDMGQEMIAGGIVAEKADGAGEGEMVGKNVGLDEREVEGKTAGADEEEGQEKGQVAREGRLAGKGRFAGEDDAAGDKTMDATEREGAGAATRETRRTNNADKRFLCNALDYLSSNRLREACEIVRRGAGMEDWSVEHIQGNLAAEMPDEIVRELLRFVRKFVRDSGGGLEE